MRDCQREDIESRERLAAKWKLTVQRTFWFMQLTDSRAVTLAQLIAGNALDQTFRSVKLLDNSASAVRQAMPGTHARAKAVSDSSSPGAVSSERS